MLPPVPAPLVSSLELCKFKRRNSLQHLILQQKNDQFASLETCPSRINLVAVAPSNEATHNRNFHLTNGNTKHEQNRKQQANKDSPEWNLTNAGSEN